MTSRILPILARLHILCHRNQTLIYFKLVHVPAGLSFVFPSLLTLLGRPLAQSLLLATPLSQTLTYSSHPRAQPSRKPLLPLELHIRHRSILFKVLLKKVRTDVRIILLPALQKLLMIHKRLDLPHFLT